MRRIALALLLCAAVSAQVAEKANQNYRTEEGRAEIARALVGPDRNKTERPRELVQAMELRPGMKVADVGTGVGFMLPYLSKAVGPTGQVIAEDIAPDFLERARMRSTAMSLTNITYLLGAEDDPKLPGGVLDAVLVLDTYHHFDYPEAMLRSIHDSLLSDGKLYIVDFFRRMDAMGPGTGDRALQHVRLDMDGVIKEVEANGFRLVSKREHVPGSQYLAVFEKAPE